MPCFVCGATLENVTPEADNQPYAGTVSTSPGHYGSTFWDPMSVDEELVVNLCDPCLRQRTDRLGIVTPTSRGAETYHPYTS